MTDNWIVDWLIKRKEYNPSQPRAERGMPIGGQWINAGGYGKANPNAFARARDETLDPAYGAFVTRYSPEEYRAMGATCYVSKTGRSGYAVKPDGDIISLFAAKGSGEGRQAFADAIRNGGTKLDCFDGFLPGLYAQFGFKEYDRWKWDDQYAPPGWNKERFDSPDVVLMRLER